MRIGVWQKFMIDEKLFCLLIKRSWMIIIYPIMQTVLMMIINKLIVQISIIIGTISFEEKVGFYFHHDSKINQEIEMKIFSFFQRLTP